MRRAVGIASVALLLAGAFTLGFALAHGSPPTRPAVAPARLDPHQPQRLVDEVRLALSASYYRSIPRSILAQPTVGGIIAGLDDPHTAYLTPARYASLQTETADSYSGVGLRVGPAKSGLIVVSALEGPARKAGIRAGDVIVAIEGRSTRELRFPRSLALLEGREGTRVRLTVKRPDEGRVRFSLVRREIPLPALHARLLSASKEKIAYVRLLSLRASTADRLTRRMDALVRRGAAGLVLDLRGSPGGLLSEAVETASIFLEEGVVCTTAGRHQPVRVYAVSGTATYPRLPMVVLVDRSTASASEILAAALAEHDRAAVVGRRTYGKASVQSVRELSNGGALKLTTATYRTPSGKDLLGHGIRPRVRVSDDPRTAGDEALLAAKQALLAQLPRERP